MHLNFFTDPVLRAPTLGSMLICMTAAVIGVLVFVRKRSLLGEALSHASYPGVTAAILGAGFFAQEEQAPLWTMCGAFLTALAGFGLISWMEKKRKVKPDAALAAIIALFFGLGVTIASLAQASYSYLFRHMQTYLFGQAATLREIHLLFYGALFLLVSCLILFFYYEIQILLFDRTYGYMNKVVHKVLEPLLFFLTVLTIVAGVRCVGVVLMSAMLIAPAAAARQWTHKLSTFFILSALFGAASAYLGVVASFYLSQHLPGRYALPTGPTMVVVSSFFALFSLAFAPNRGIKR